MKFLTSSPGFLFWPSLVGGKGPRKELGYFLSVMMSNAYLGLLPVHVVKVMVFFPLQSANPKVISPQVMSPLTRAISPEN